MDKDNVADSADIPETLDIKLKRLSKYQCISVSEESDLIKMKMSQGKL